MPENDKTALLRLSELLVDFTYGEMMEVARRFDSVASDRASLTTPEDWASLFHDVAQVEVEENDHGTE